MCREGKNLWIGGCGGEIAAKETDRMDCVCYQDLWQMEIAGIKGGAACRGAQLADLMDEWL